MVDYLLDGLSMVLFALVPAMAIWVLIMWIALLRRRKKDGVLQADAVDDVRRSTAGRSET